MTNLTRTNFKYQNI